MTTSYVPTNVQQGFGAELQINQNFTNIQTALNEVLGRLSSTDNAMAIDLDMASNQILNIPLPVSPTDPIRLQDIQTLAISPIVKTITFSSAITVDTATTTFGIITLTGNTTIDFAGATIDGQQILLRLTQDGAGGHVVTWGTSVAFSTDLPVSTPLTTTASKTDYVMLRFNAISGKYDFTAVMRGF